MRSALGVAFCVVAAWGCQTETKKEKVVRTGQVDDQVVFSLSGSGQGSQPNSVNEFLTQQGIAYSSVEKISWRQEAGQRVTTYVVNLAGEGDVDATVKHLSKQSQVGFASPNYTYEGNAFDEVEMEGEEVLNPRLSDQHHHTVMGSEMAWQVARGEGIILAVTDTGIDFDHPDLQNQLWQNPGEMGADGNGGDRASNGIDDDQNGYIDDFRGWDTTSDDGDNDPSSTSLHGTHVSGIIAAEDNTIGVVGTAPSSQVIPIRFSGSGTWNSLDVARAYAYAVAGGARIINTSFRIDQYTNDQVYLNALRDTYAAGLLIFNSAGNGRSLNPPRQAFDELLLVVNTRSEASNADTRSASSNYGWGMDLAAPGTQVLSTFQAMAMAVPLEPVWRHPMRLLWRH